MARSSGSTLRMKQQRSGSVLYRGPGSVRGLSSTRLRPYRLANPSLNAYVSAKWKPVSRKITGTVRSMRLSRCASTTPPPPKLTVRAARPGNVSTAHRRIVSGSAPLKATACSRARAALSIARAPKVAQLEEAIDHTGGTLTDRLALRVDHELRGQGLFVWIRHTGELGDLLGQGAGVQPLGVAADALIERGLARAGQTGEPQRETVRLCDARIRYQLGLSHLAPTIPFIPPLHNEAKTKQARFPREAGPICVARAVYKLVEHHPMPATTAPQPRPLPEGQGHIIRQAGQQQVVV